MLRLYDYKESLDRDDIIEAAHVATALANEKVGVSRIRTRLLRFYAGDTMLQIHPSGDMTWRMLANTAWAIRRLARNAGVFFEYTFWIFEREKLVGQGWLVSDPQSEEM